LESLLSVATNVWYALDFVSLELATLIMRRKAQSEMMEMFAKAVQNVPPPDLTHTWAQAPIKFEDALGRIMPVPSEYDWDVSLFAII